MLLGAAACAGDGTGLDPCGNPIGTAPCGSDDSVRLSASVQPIFDQNCAFAGCHAAPQPAQGMNLSRGQSFASIVDVPSVELPSMRRVRPFQPDSSYLVHKLQGTHLDVGGQGERMPLGRGPLTPEQIGLIRSWISQGARNN
ncbi:hypothetical protein HRbin33_00905 [bacterium HR33]|nr:hypothetical protein HRbin33_00905 [bacterium HR33]